jgi:FKBP-type peptidyl-prolyl cis-trans isomerase SlyD
MKNNVWAIFLSICLATVPSLLSAQNTKTEENVIKNGSVVSVEYTVSGEDGKVIDSNKGKEPLKYTQGMHQMIPGFEKEVVGMKVGGEKHFKLKPEDGYGPVNPNAVQEVPKEKIPAEGLKVGTTLTARNAQGQMMQVRVREIKEKTVVLDLNHPLAGRTLVFDIKVLKIEPQPVK